MNPVEISEKYYELIGVKSGCSWKELRKAYKLQIQRFHPDRYEEGSILKFDAEEHIKSLNIAYRYFQAYHKEHGCLPIVSAPQDTLVPPQSQPRSFKFNPNDTQDITEAPLIKKAKIPPVYTSIFVISVSLILVYFSISSFDDTAHTNKHNFKENTYKIDNQSLAKAKYLYNTTEATKITTEDAGDVDDQSDMDSAGSFFTYGSPMGSVLDAQGIPDSSENETWYYGKSKVFFENGFVKNWAAHNDNPLNTTVSVKTRIYRKSSD